MQTADSEVQSSLPKPALNQLENVTWTSASAGKAAMSVTSTFLTANMYDLETSPSARKRQKLSSPIYDSDQIDLSQNDLDTLDKIEKNLSQNKSPRIKSYERSVQSPRTLAQVARQKRQREIEAALRAAATADKENIHEGGSEPAKMASLSPEVICSSSLWSDLQQDNPFSISQTNTEYPPGAYPSFQTASKIPFSIGFQSTSIPTNPGPSSQPYQRSPSPEVPPEIDYTSWFEPQVPVMPLNATFFPLASAASVIPTEDPADLNTEPSEPGPSQVAPPLLGFLKASNKGFIMPSAAALLEAEKKIRTWQESDPEPNSVPQLPPKTTPVKLLQNSSSYNFNDSFSAPDTPSPAGPSDHAGFRRASGGLPSFSSPSLGPTSAFNSKPKPFKSPLAKSKHPINLSSTNYSSSPLNPNRGFVLASSHRQHHPLASAPIRGPAMTSVRSSLAGGFISGAAGFSTPSKPGSIASPLQSTPTGSTPAKFVTPFKPGMKPGEMGRRELESDNVMLRTVPVHGHPVAVPAAIRSPDAVSATTAGKGKVIQRVFNLTKPSRRQTLVSSGFIPQHYNFDELEAMGLNVAELSQMTPALALYYTFHTTSTELDSCSRVPTRFLGSAAALEQLLEQGCTLATKSWVDNHWAMILWKLAGMAYLDPESESDGKKKRWCWKEVMRQLCYRYERELNTGSRPPLRKICTQDAPASCPMILCVSGITWSEGGMDEDGIPVPPHPKLEVTDGWYRLRAQIDDSLARAVRKGVLRVGRKIAVAGMRLSSERKDPQEILEAYNSTHLIITGNSSHLAPWHAKLGFHPQPFITQLHHLNPDGGDIAVLAVTIKRAFPIGYFEYSKDQEGNKERDGPLDHKTENDRQEKWKARRDVEASKLYAELDKKMSIFEGYADHLSRRAGSQFQPGEDELAPENIDDLCDQLENPEDASRIISSLNSTEAGWLARCIREKLIRNRENAVEEIEQELQKICPPRDVRDFRVLFVQDMYCNRRPSVRQAQLTMWGAMALNEVFGEFQPGQNYMVTNLRVSQPRSWMGRYETDSEVFLASGPRTRCTRLAD